MHTRLSRRGQAGFTLLEAIVSLALVSGVVLSLAAGLLTTVRSSTSAKDTQLADAALSAYAESFKGETLGSCSPGDGTFPEPEPAWFAASASVDSWAVTKVEEWNGSGWGPCTGSSDAHRLTVEVKVEASDGQQTATGQVGVRNES